MKKTKLVWRLSNRPKVEEITLLHEKGLLTKDEAKEILFSEQTQEDREKDSLDAEIKFLKEIIESLSRGTVYREVIRQVPYYYQKYDWYEPTITWCNSMGGSTIGITAGTNIITYGNTTEIL
jgi:hypothetical protein